MAGVLDIASDVASASAALAGLILVFFAAALSDFGGFDAGQQEAVRDTYRWRAWPAFAGFVASLAACGLALFAKAESSSAAAVWAAAALALAALSVLVAAVSVVREIG
jgi:hypothetical protein